MTKTASRSKVAKAPKAPATTELLLEIGTEELPYQFVAPAMRVLQQSAETLLKDLRLTYGTVRTMGTPRRLVLLIEGLSRQQASAVKEAMGPSKSVAFDQNGQPTRAAVGFAAGQGIPVEDLQVRQTPKGEYLFAVKQEKGQPVAAVLLQALPQLLGKLSFPKAMHWNQTGVRFARPVRWLVALCGGKVLPIHFATIKAGNLSHGHRVLGAKVSSPKGFAVTSIAHYLKETERHGVIVDQERRRAMILDQLASLAKSARGHLHQDDDLLEQAVYMVESPLTILGSFKPHYLSLPKEILMTSMKEHQGYFSLVDQKGGLLPNFLAVTNMKLSNMQLIREGNERVLAARLADAKFFFDEDRKTSLIDRVPKQLAVTFHQKLGSLHQKTQRVVAMAAHVAGQLGDDRLVQESRRAAELSKADLLTGIVGEFPTLQGLMGGEYAKHDGESPVVSAAIREQYMPRAMEGELPESLAGKVLSLADRLDSIAGFFLVGLVPSGSEDPFALRRHATAIVRIVIEGQLRLDLAQAVRAAQDVLSGQHVVAAPQSGKGAPDVIGFLFERVRFYGKSAHQLRDDVMDAVLKSADRQAIDLTDLFDRMKALQQITVRAEFDPLIVGFKRAHRLTEKEQWDRKPVESGLFREGAESALHQTVQSSQQEYAAAMRDGQYGQALDVLVRMKGPIDDFFNAVMVNADDPAVRGNRLSLLKSVDDLFMSFADFSQIMVQGT
ncbi:MAG: glycine--tRNA ligase subunit beta [Nitrospira sp.]|nr:glycine--tRNA ligase subunit beta [Nitrospira sp.]MBP6607825.1 glycine--tRNA ligase subunit beta [Nitrospira sp.]HQY58948.1 glycine--tRNA ligase subunit beta [Nitrospira sp.]HRA96606.1 glycine--tRNA ligase subunit beta [Nitrospira sp.]